jgi:hypothetical protein
MIHENLIHICHEKADIANQNAVAGAAKQQHQKVLQKQSLVTLVTQSHLGCITDLYTRSQVHASMNNTQQQQPQTCPDGSYHVMRT